MIKKIDDKEQKEAICMEILEALPECLLNFLLVICLITYLFKRLFVIF